MNIKAEVWTAEGKQAHVYPSGDVYFIPKSVHSTRYMQMYGSRERAHIVLNNLGYRRLR